MNANANLIRAVSSEFVSRKLKSVALLFSIVATLALLVGLRLPTVSAWWWLLAAPIITLAILGLLAYILAKIIIKTFRPELTKLQAANVSNFVDKLERVADNLQSPMFIIIFRLVRDVVRPRGQTFIQAAAKDSTTLHTDFLKLQHDFK